MEFEITPNSTLPPEMVRYVRLVEANDSIYECWKGRKLLPEQKRLETRAFLEKVLRERADHLELLSGIDRFTFPVQDVQFEEAHAEDSERDALGANVTPAELRDLADDVVNDKLCEKTFVSLDRVVADVSCEVFDRVDGLIAP